jgi:hypothetical protein
MRPLLFAFLVACAPYKPVPSDGGTTQDVATKEAAACVPDFSACTATSICCIGSSVCNAGSGLCQKACLGVGSVCSGGDCCSGICNGTCE